MTGTIRSDSRPANSCDSGRIFHHGEQGEHGEDLNCFLRALRVLRGEFFGMRLPGLFSAKLVERRCQGLGDLVGVAILNLVALKQEHWFAFTEDRHGR